MAATSDASVLYAYGVDLKNYDYPKSATFLIDSDSLVRFARDKQRGAALSRELINKTGDG